MDWFRNRAAGTSRRASSRFARSLSSSGPDRQAEGLGGLEVDDQLELGGLLKRQIAWLRAFRILSTIAAAVRPVSVMFGP
jgi:hypothetical protein